jgi:4-aminobutyrate aminotransferase-like enzyme
MIWRKAEGCRVTLDDGRVLLDLTGGFGVAALGHRNPRILEAWRSQEVVHALGDLAEAEVTVRLRRALPRPAKLGVTGEDAVEIALRTALLATGRPGIVAFDGAYHGTGLLALAATGFERFRAPFAPWLPGPVYRFPYGEDPGPLPADAACVIVEPVQGRAGSLVPPPEFLAQLRRRCDEAGALLVVDAIYAGLGRTGELWPGDDVADVLCVGKALGGGLPLSAALFYRDGLEEVWDLGPEDVYTHTHAGSPLACAAALVVLDEVPRLLERVAAAGDRFEAEGWHGRGLLRAREGSADDALARGVLVIPAGLDGALIQATPPLTITDDELDEAFSLLCSSSAVARRAGTSTAPGGASSHPGTPRAPGSRARRGRAR